MPVGSFPNRSPAELRRLGLGNLIRMGHCAPTVMQTMLDASDVEADWLVKLTAGLPGGIGNTGAECGGLTAPLIMIGLRHRRDEVEDGLPVVVHLGHDLLRRFASAHGTTQCRDIRGDAQVPLRCVGVVREAPSMCAQCLAARPATPIPPEARAAYRELCADWERRGYHCADAVFAALGPAVTTPPELRDALTAFMGGTLFTGMTCSALTAGVMALGLALGEIEDSRPRVIKMIATMAIGGDAFADDVNAFNRLMNLGHGLAEWFESEFTSTQCRSLTGADFSSVADVRAYLERDGTATCEAIARGVAARVAELIKGHIEDIPPTPDPIRSG